MKNLDKTGQMGAFGELDKRRQKAIKLLFEDELTDEQIAKNVQRSRSTLDNWKNDPKFKEAQHDYQRLVVKESYASKALMKLYNLMQEAKSEMVQLQSAISILKMAGMFSENDNPDMIRAKVRKANAEASITEWKAKELHGDNDSKDKVTLVDDIGGDGIDDD
nr:MAG TPA: Helix-turn-helix of insertion element transposase [Caudoviricetes sp.]